MNQLTANKDLGGFVVLGVFLFVFKKWQKGFKSSPPPPKESLVSFAWQWGWL